MAIPVAMAHFLWEFSIEISNVIFGLGISCEVACVCGGKLVLDVMLTCQHLKHLRK